MANKNYFGITIEELKMRMEDMSESDEDVWESEDESSSGSEKKSSLDSEEEKEDEFFFEGAEKLLEIWFTTKNQNGNEGDLRSIPRYSKYNCSICLSI